MPAYLTLPLFQAILNSAASGHHLDDLSQETFPLPSLGSKLRALSDELHNGRGAIILRGLSPGEYGLKDNITIFAGLSSYIADIRGAQSSELDMISKFLYFPGNIF